MFNFIICKSEDLPISIERDEETFYYLYDKLLLFKGRVLYTDPFMIVETLPEDGKRPSNYMLYISIEDGSIWQVYDYELREIAELSNPEALEYLKASGSTYFTKSDYRYLDMQTKSIILPYENGSYQLGLSLANDLAIDENLVVKFDPKNSRFIFDGDLQEPDHGNWRRIQDYTGSRTDSVETVVEDGVIKSNFRISREEDNILQNFGDGLFVYTGDKAKLEDFNRLKESFEEYKITMDAYQQLVEEVIQNAETTLGTLPEKILEAMEVYSENIEEVLANYDEIAEEFEKLKNDTNSYMEQATGELYEQVESFLQSVNDPWKYF